MTGFRGDTAVVEKYRSSEPTRWTIDQNTPGFSKWNHTILILYNNEIIGSQKDIEPNGIPNLHNDEKHVWRLKNQFL